MSGRDPPPPKRRNPPRQGRSTAQEQAAQLERLTRENEQLRLTVESLYARESVLQSVIDALPAWIWVKDLAGRFRLVNRALLQERGAAASDVVGKTSAEVPELVATNPEQLLAADRQVQATGEPVEVPSYTVRLPDGREQLRRLVKVPLRDEEGGLLGIVGWSEDVTEAARADEALEAQRRLLRTVIDLVPYPLSYVDTQGHLQMVNPAWCKVAGCTAEEAIGLTVAEVRSIPEAARTEMFRETQAMLRDRTPTSRQEVTMRDPDGSERHLIVSKALVPGPDGSVSGLVTGVVDVTEVRRSEQAATQARQRLLDAMEAMPALLMLYDADERLVHANSMTRDHFPNLRTLLQPGAPLRRLLEVGAANVAPAGPAQEQWVRQRLHDFRHPPESFEQPLQNGRVLLGRDRKTSEGGTISVRFDITEQKRVQQELEQRERQIQADLALAADLQRAILRPVVAPRYLDVAFHFQPSSAVSGDLYHASTDADGAWRFFIGDATGHGVAAAFLTILIEAGLNATPPRTRPAGLLAALNRSLLQYELDGRFVSGICLRVAPEGRVELSNAGHPQALALLRRRDEPEPLGVAGFPLGWFAEAPYESTVLQLQPGDSLLLYTDGLTEWSDSAGRQLGGPQLLALAREHGRQSPAGLIKRLLEAARSHSGGTAPGDDLTVFALTYRGQSAD